MGKVHDDGEFVQGLRCVLSTTGCYAEDVRPWVFFGAGLPDPLYIPCAVEGRKAKGVCPGFTTREAAETWRKAMALTSHPIPHDASLVRLTKRHARMYAQKAARRRIALVLDPPPLHSLAKWN